MESIISSDDSDSCDSEMKSMKTQLTAFGFEEENVCKEEMRNLLKALNFSKTYVKDDEIKSKQITCTNSTISQPRTMKRRYLNVRDRRLPWSLLPSTITSAEKARTLAVYIKLMSVNNYRQARQSATFASWPPPIQIVEESTRVQPVRSTRSGRSAPSYAAFDDDSSDLDFVITKTKKRKISSCDHGAGDAIYSSKVVSLKRKTAKEDNNRPVKDQKLCTEHKVVESISAQNSMDANNVTVIED